MPFAGYKNFQDCVNKNRDKKDPEAYCASIKRRVEGKSISDFKYNFDFEVSKEAKKSKEPSKRIIKGIASIEEVDRDYEVVSIKAIKSGLSEWMKNPVIRWKHSEPIGKGLDAYIDGSKFYITAQISDKTKTANEVWGLIEDGIVKSFSIAGKVMDTEKMFNEDLGKDITHITKMELYEVSVTDLPANRNSFFEVVSKSLKDNAYERLGDMVNKTDEYKNKKEIKMEKTEKPEEIVKEEAEKPEETQEKPEEKQEKPEEKQVDIESLVEKQVKQRVEEAMKKFIESQPYRKAEKVETKKEIPTSESGIAKFAIVDYGTPSYMAKEIFPFEHESSYYEPSTSSKSVEDSREGFTFKEAYLEKYTYTQTGGTGTAGYALIPVYVDPDIIDRTRRELPTVELIPRRAVKGTTYDYNAITSLTNAVFLPEDASLSDLTDTYDRYSVKIKYVYSTGRVTGPMIAGSKGYADALAREVKNRTIGLKRVEDQKIFSGDSSTYPNEFDGFDNLISTNATALSGALTIAAMRTEITQCRNSGGVVDLIITTNSVSDDLKGLLMDYQRYVNTTELAWGITTMTFDGIPVIVDRYATSGYMYFLDTSVIFMAVLQDATYEELAKTNDSVKFTIKMYEALVIRAETFCSILTGIS